MLGPVGQFPGILRKLQPRKRQLCSCLVLSFWVRVEAMEKSLKMRKAKARARIRDKTRRRDNLSWLPPLISARGVGS